MFQYACLMLLNLWGLCRSRIITGLDWFTTIPGLKVQDIKYAATHSETEASIRKWRAKWWLQFMCLLSENCHTRIQLTDPVLLWSAEAHQELYKHIIINPNSIFSQKSENGSNDECKTQFQIKPELCTGIMELWLLHVHGLVITHNLLPSLFFL